MTDPSDARDDGRPSVPPDDNPEDAESPGGGPAATAVQSPYLVV